MMACLAEFVSMWTFLESKYDNTENLNDFKPSVANCKVSEAIVLADFADIVEMMTGLCLMGNS